MFQHHSTTISCNICLRSARWVPGVLVSCNNCSQCLLDHKGVIMILLLPLLSIQLRGAAGEPQPLLYNNGLVGGGPGFCPNGGLCVPHMYCAVHYAEHVSSSATTPCWLALNTPGLCCYPTYPSVPQVGRPGLARED